MVEETLFLSNPSCDLEDHPTKVPSIQLRYTMVFSEVRLIQESMTEALLSRSGYGRVLSVSNLEEAAKQIEAVGPDLDLVLVDATLPDGLATVKWLRGRNPISRLMAFNVDEAVQDMRAWTGAGVFAYIGRSGTMKDVIELISTRMDGAAASRVKLNSDLMIGLSSSRITSPEAAVLTGREEQVAQLLVAGESNKEIARLLNISVPTVKSHVHNLLGKLGLQRRGKLALQYGSVSDAIRRGDNARADPQVA
jgi:two-component system nitrate/nitrite response regulator NarL